MRNILVQSFKTEPHFRRTGLLCILPNNQETISKSELFPVNMTDVANPLPGHVFLHTFHWGAGSWVSESPACTAGKRLCNQPGQPDQGQRPALDIAASTLAHLHSLPSQPRQGVVAGHAKPSWGSIVRRPARIKALHRQYTYQRGFLYYFVNLSYYAINCVSLSIESNMYLLHIKTLPDITEDKRTSRHSPWLVKLSA